MNTLTDRTALVTGASRGIGRASAIALAKAGCNVVVNYLHSRDLAEEVAREVSSLGRRSLAIQADVSIEADVKRLVAETEAQFAPIDILVNNAGINPSKPLESLTLDDWNRVLTANLTSVFLLTQAVLPGMRLRSWGRLIMLSSIAAQTGGVIGPHYAASKAGMLGLVHSYANLLAKENITANAIAPALIETDMIRNNPKIQPTLLPVGRFGTAEEVAEAVVFLATNGYITGQTINLNGGWYMS
jgi:3-oxoacyl-[acyl-carrier protein] reductase